MKMNVLERLMLMPLLPKEGSFVTLRLVRTMVQKIGLSGEEMKEFDIQEKTAEDGQHVVSWNAKGEIGRDIDIGEKETEVVVKALTELDKQGKLTQQQYTLFEKFVEPKKEV